MAGSGALVPKAQVEEIPEAEHWMGLYLELKTEESGNSLQLVVN